MSDGLVNNPGVAGRLNRAWCQTCHEETVHDSGRCVTCKQPQRPAPAVQLDASKFEARERLKRPRAEIVSPVHDHIPPEIDDVEERPIVYAEAHKSQHSEPPAAPAGVPIMSNSKQCSVCSETKPLDAFPTSPTCKDGHTGQCKACIAAKARERYQAKHGKTPASGKHPRAKPSVQTSAEKPVRRKYTRRPQADPPPRAKANGELRIPPSPGLAVRLNATVVELTIGEHAPALLSHEDMDRLTAWWKDHRDAA